MSYSDSMRDMLSSAPFTRSVCSSIVYMTRFLTPHGHFRRLSSCLMSWYSACRGFTASPSIWTCPSTPAYLRRSPQLRWEWAAKVHIIQDQYLTWYPLQVYKRREHCSDCACTRTPTSGSEVSSCQMTLLANFLSFCLYNYMPVKCLNWRVVHFYVMCSASGCNTDVNNSLN